MGGRSVLVVAGLLALGLVFLLRGSTRDSPGLARGVAEASSAQAALEAVLAPEGSAGKVGDVAAVDVVEGLRSADGARSEVPGEVPAWILGALVDPGGQPIAGAEVTLFDGPLSEGEPHERKTLVSAADGRYRFVAPARDGRFGVRATAPGFVTRSRDQSTDVDVPFELAPALRAHGRILGEGAERAQVYRLSAEAAPERVDDGAGRWSAEGLPLGRVTRFELLPCDAAPRPFALEPSEPGELVHDLVLGQRLEYAGRVVDLLTRRPIAGAVLARESELPAGRLGVSDVEGAFTVAVRVPGEVEPVERELPTLLAEAPGYLTRAVALGWLARTGELELVPSGILEGRVLDGEGRAVAGAELIWTGARYLQDPLLGSLVVPDLPSVTSAGDGSFRLVGVPCAMDECGLEVVHGTKRHFVPDVAPERPGEPRVLEIRLPRGRTLLGQLAWEDAELLPRADLQARFAGEPDLPPLGGIPVQLAGADGELHTVSDARGAFRFEQLPAGELLVSCPSFGTQATIQPGEEPASREAAGDSFLSVTLSVPLPQRTLRGVLREPDGLGCNGAELVVRLERHGRPGQGVRYVTRSDEHGSFALEVPVLAFLDTRLTLERGVLELWHAGAAAAIDWTLPELAPVELELGSAPADPKHWLDWSGPGAEEGGRVSSPLRFGPEPLLLSLPAGTLTLSLRGPDGLRREQPVEVRAGPEAQRIVLGP